MGINFTIFLGLPVNFFVDFYHISNLKTHLFLMIFYETKNEHFPNKYFFDVFLCKTEKKTIKKTIDKKYFSLKKYEKKVSEKEVFIKNNK